ncbi:HEAT repeat domain-containing protein [Deinococcus apachensis]|uniref:HEAT repeat domain-containing protein n=1 Tax=Deinococcus apachensis TaxID=309886 RepID=UPI000382EFBE|nr:HEAT repeat domain-containing protein [Deinococcus apachensis]
MRQLPAAPSLEHLRRQAKSLLKAFLSGHPGARERFSVYLPRLVTLEDRRARLADAQFVLAWEYGFPGWARLKTYVEAVERFAMAAPDPRAERRLARRQFVHDLAASLLTWSRHHDPQALGARFARMPLHDILAVRKHLDASGELADVVGGLIEGLGHGQPRVRFDCANALDHLVDERCAEPLRHLLSDPVSRVRRAALHSLSCDACKLSPLVPAVDLLPTLIAMALGDPSIRVRRATVPLLESYCRDARLEETLRRLALEEDQTVKRTALEVLWRRGLSAEERG